MSEEYDLFAKGIKALGDPEIDPAEAEANRLQSILDEIEMIPFENKRWSVYSYLYNENYNPVELSNDMINFLYYIYCWKPCPLQRLYRSIPEKAVNDLPLVSGYLLARLKTMDNGLTK